MNVDEFLDGSFLEGEVSASDDEDEVLSSEEDIDLSGDEGMEGEFAWAFCMARYMVMGVMHG